MFHFCIVLRIDFVDKRRLQFDDMRGSEKSRCRIYVQCPQKGQKYVAHLLPPPRHCLGELGGTSFPFIHLLPPPRHRLGELGGSSAGLSKCLSIR